MNTTVRVSAEREADEFRCTECGQDVISLPALDPPPTVCGLCRHLLEFVPDPQEREAIRHQTRGGKL